MDLLYGISILAVDYFVLSQCARSTDGQTDVDSKNVCMHSQSQLSTVTGRVNRSKSIERQAPKPLGTGEWLSQQLNCTAEQLRSNQAQTYS